MEEASQQKIQNPKSFFKERERESLEQTVFTNTENKNITEREKNNMLLLSTLITFSIISLSHADSTPSHSRSLGFFF